MAFVDLIFSFINYVNTIIAMLFDIMMAFLTGCHLLFSILVEVSDYVNHAHQLLITD